MQRLVLISTVLLCGLLAGSCNIVGPVAAIAAGPPKIDKAFDLPKDSVTVVLVEDTGSPPRLRDSRLVRRIAESATAELVRKGVVRTAIEPGPIHMLSIQPSERQTPIADLARKVNAQQIVYAEVTSFTLSPDGQTYAPSAELRVRVLNAVAEQDNTVGERIWPPDPKGHVLIAGGESVTGFRPRDAAEIRQAEEELADLAGLRLAQLFYDRERDSVSNNRP